MKLLTILALLVVSMSCNAQTIKEIFQALPDTILPSLSKNDRLDLIDLIENKMENEVTNQLRGRSRMTLLTANLTKVQLSELAEVQMCRLSTPNSYLICLIHSVKTETWDSNICFYNPNWTLNSTVTSIHSTLLSHTSNFSFVHLNFINETTLQLNTETPSLTTLPIEASALKEGREDGHGQGGAVTFHWDTNQARFLPSIP